jgi:hypothetical protein
VGRVLADLRPVAGAEIHAHRPVQLEWLRPLPWGLVAGEFLSRVEVAPVGQATTDAEGRFELELPAGNPWRIHATARSWAPGTSDWLWIGGQATQNGLDLVLERPGALAGRLVGTVGPVALEWIAAGDGEGHLRVTRTATDGGFWFSGLAPGLWQVRPIGAPPLRHQLGMAWPPRAGERPAPWNAVVVAGESHRLTVRSSGPARGR